MKPAHEFADWMQRAIDLAWRGQGRVEPNPMVGCVLLSPEGDLLGEGWHQRHGGPHAEVEALNSVTADQRPNLRDAIALVTLEPCSHHGKTGPCSEALIQAGIGRVIYAHPDPNPLVAGGGHRQLEAAGIRVESGLNQEAAAHQLAPYLKRQRTGRPWVIAKWAMSVDGKIGTASGDSQWISGEASRREVHQLRGRMDAILTGIGTVLADDPRLTARPAGPRTPLRVVLDPSARLPMDSQLAQTASETPTLIAVGCDVASSRIQALEKLGVEVFVSRSFRSTDHHPANGGDRAGLIEELLDELGQNRQVTNLMLEAGGGLLGSLNDLQAIDELQIYLGARLIGGASAPTPVGGCGVESLADAGSWQLESMQQLEQDIQAIYRRMTG